MKNIPAFILSICVIAMLIACSNDEPMGDYEEPNPCTVADENETEIDNTLLAKQDTVIEFIEHTLGKIEFYSGSWTIETHPDGLNSSFFIPSFEHTLVPCNLGERYKIVELIVSVSGRRMSSCGVVTFPQVSSNWGCKFEITSIKSLSDSNSLP